MRSDALTSGTAALGKTEDVFAKGVAPLRSAVFLISPMRALGSLYWILLIEDTVPVSVRSKLLVKLMFSSKAKRENPIYSDRLPPVYPWQIVGWIWDSGRSWRSHLRVSLGPPC